MAKTGAGGTLFSGGIDCVHNNVHIAVVNNHVMSIPHQAPRDLPAHPAETDDTQLYKFISCCKECELISRV